jgi:transposase
MINVIGLDIAKNVFQVHGIDSAGQLVLQRKLGRADVLRLFARLEPALIGLEACAGAHYWAREITALGHTVRLMPPQFVKPYVKSQKNYIAIAIGTTPISMLWRKFTDPAKAMDSMRCLWRCAG